MAIIALAAGAVALPFVTFGALTAIGGETSILTVGVVIVAVFIGLLLLLATVLLIHGYVEFRYSGGPLGRGTNKPSLVYRGTRLVETVVSGIFGLSLITSLVFMLVTERVPSVGAFAVVSSALVYRS
ncbi:hypothetical protein [Halorubrum californiense]|uniref:hypothetical protein n=1 Tax=Halorubrum californiense TaxID=416585 RepID=UPI001269792B|nr:hypothetical protein [Halorubrum californiense]